MATKASLSLRGGLWNALFNGAEESIFFSFVDGFSPGLFPADAAGVIGSRARLVDIGKGLSEFTKVE